MGDGGHEHRAALALARALRLPAERGWRQRFDPTRRTTGVTTVTQRSGGSCGFGCDIVRGWVQGKRDAPFTDPKRNWSFGEVMKDQPLTSLSSLLGFLPSLLSVPPPPVIRPTEGPPPWACTRGRCTWRRAWGKATRKGSKARKKRRGSRLRGH